MVEKSEIAKVISLCEEKNAIFSVENLIFLLHAHKTPIVKKIKREKIA